MVSPYAKTNFVDSTYTEQTSVTKFIQDNFGLGRLGGIAFDERAGELNNMFDFNGEKAPKLFLNETDGTVAKDYASIEHVDVTPRAGTNLKPVVEGMNDPKVTENGVPEITKLQSETKPSETKPSDDKKDEDKKDKSSESSKGGVFAILAVLAAAAAGVVGWFMNGHPGLDLDKLGIKLPF